MEVIGEDHSSRQRQYAGSNTLEILKLLMFRIGFWAWH
jgi:hypothetical protein